MDLADMKLSGMSTREIAEEKGVTRQAISFILRRYFRDITFPRVNKAIVFTKKCKYSKCKGIISGPKSYLELKKYHSHECMLKDKGFLNWNTTTKKQRLAVRARTARLWYNKHKDDPEFRKVIQQRNKRQAKARKMRLWRSKK